MTKNKWIEYLNKEKQKKKNKGKTLGEVMKIASKGWKKKK